VPMMITDRSTNKRTTPPGSRTEVDRPGASTAPAALRDRILEDLRAVRPLRPPALRAIYLAPVGALLVVGIPWRYGLRPDAAALGPAALWGLSLAQVALALLVAAWAFREVIPGRARSRTATTGLFVLAAGALFAITIVTWQRSPTVPTPEQWRPFWRICFRSSFLLGLAPTLLILWLASRALLARPLWVGALAGLAGGAMTDAGWRAFCEISAPRHVLAAHGGAILALVIVAATLARSRARIARRGHTSSLG
jgi:hypothetical protein